MELLSNIEILGTNDNLVIKKIVTETDEMNCSYTASRVNWAMDAHQK